MHINYDVPLKPIFENIASNMLENMIEYGQGLLGLEYKESIEEVFK